MNPTTKSAIIVVLLILLIGMVGSMTLQDALDEQARYCEGVSSGMHPDYNGNAATVCKAED